MIKQIRAQGFFLLSFLVVLFLFRGWTYLLFHTAAELFSVIIAYGVFILAWNTRDHTDQKWLVWLGIAFLAVGTLDFFHTLAFEGMPLQAGLEYPGNQLWVIARSVESLSLLIFAACSGRELKLPWWLVFLGYGLVVGLALASVFWWRIFPVCFIQGQGQTLFKLVMEYVIIAVLAGVIAIALVRRTALPRLIWGALVVTAAITIVQELCFTLYFTNTGLFNVLGHFLKICSFYVVYQTILRTGLRDPFALVYANLKASESDLRSANAAKDKFITLIAHDLRNPISNIQNQSELILHRTENLAPEELAIIQGISRGAGQALRLIEDLLAWAQIRAGTRLAHPEPVKVQFLLQNAIELLQTQAQAKKIRIEQSPSSTPAWINADPAMTAAIVRNLLSNAIKFSHPGGVVRIAVAAGREVRISIIDSGVGIDAASLKTLFSLEQGRTTVGTAGEKGTGFGLVMCREFALINGGSLDATSQPGQGSSFMICLPALELPKAITG